MRQNGSKHYVQPIHMKNDKVGDKTTTNKNELTDSNFPLKRKCPR